MNDQLRPQLAGVYANTRRPPAPPGPGEIPIPTGSQITPGPIPDGIDKLDLSADTEAELGQNVPSDFTDSDKQAYGVMGSYLSEYYALKDPEQLAIEVERIVDECKNIMRGSGIYKQARSNYGLFYAMDGYSLTGENLKEDGDGGGSIALAVNVLKNAVDHLIGMVKSNRPAIDPITNNSSVAANDITTIAKAIIDNRLHRDGDVAIFDECLKQCPILGASFLYAFWDSFKGKRNPPTGPLKKGQGLSAQHLQDGTPISPVVTSGDMCIEPLSILDVFYDMSAKTWEKDVDDCVVRLYRNRYDLMAQYPNRAEDIKKAPAKSMTRTDEYLPSPTFAITQIPNTPSAETKIEVWGYFHKRTAAVPHGRMQIQLPQGAVLESTTLPEWVQDLPVFRLCPDTMVGTPHGYPVVTSSGGLQEALNIGASALITNMAAFSRRLILSQKGTNVDVTSITGDLKLLEVEFGPSGQPPLQALDLMGSQQPLQELLGWLVGQIEQDTGANSIVRGDPQGVTAGVAINLYQSMALQFSSPYEEARAKAIAWFATHLVRSYQAHPDVEREVKIIGKRKIASLRNFYGSDLTGIDSYTVDPGNPATRTLAMRYNMAQALKQDGVMIPPEKLIHLIQTGDWADAIEEPADLDDVIRWENEQMLAGESVMVIPGDDPVHHAQGHLALLANPTVRSNPALIKNVMDHYAQHAQMLAQGDIVTKMAAGMLPMGPFTPPGLPLAHGDTPTPTPGSQPPPQAQGPHEGAKGIAPVTKPPRHLEALKPPPAPSAPPVPGVSQ